MKWYTLEHAHKELNYVLLQQKFPFAGFLAPRCSPLPGLAFNFRFYLGSFQFLTVVVRCLALCFFSVETAQQQGTQNLCTDFHHQAFIQDCTICFGNFTWGIVNTSMCKGKKAPSSYPSNVNLFQIPRDQYTYVIPLHCQHFHNSLRIV